MKKMPGCCEAIWSRGSVFLLAVSTLVVASCSLETASWKESYLSLLGWIQGLGPEAILWIVCLQALVVLLVLPGPYFTLGAGFLFGTLGGGFAAVGGSVLGAVLAYWIARGLSGKVGGEKFRQRLQNSPKFSDVLHVLQTGGWRVVLVTRLTPFFPFKLSNYFFGWIRFPFFSFFWGTLFGIIPATMVSVSAGSLVSDLSLLLEPGSMVSGSQGNMDREWNMGREWIWSALGMGLAVIFVIAVGSKARRDWTRLKKERGL